MKTLLILNGLSYDKRDDSIGKECYLKSCTSIGKERDRGGVDDCLQLNTKQMDLLSDSNLG